MHLKTLDSHDELDAIETLQTKIWHFEPQSVTPRHVFIAAVRSGGLVLGAFDHTDTLVGFSLAFRGEKDGEPCLYSHLTGVLSALQGQGFGYRLKMAQRDFALEHGLNCIIWTFDPLMMPNARLNLQKLGGQVFDYIPNAYGSSAFRMYGDGFPTHRFELCWRVDEGSLLSDERLARRERDLLNAPLLIETDTRGWPSLNEQVLEQTLAGAQAALPIPENHLGMRQTDKECAQAWQAMFFRCADQCLMGHHYVEAFRGTQSGGLYLLSPR